MAYYINTDTPESQQATMDVFTKLLAAAASKLSAGQRTRLQWNDGSVCCLMDPKGELLYCVVTSLLTYPERLAYQLLYDLQAQTTQLEADLDGIQEDGLMGKLEPKMKDLVKYYEDSSNFPQFALGMSRESISSNQSSASLTAGTENNGRTGKIVGGLLVVLLIVGIVIFFLSRQGSAATMAIADADAVNVVHIAAHIDSIAKSANGAARNVITMLV